jgi:hypothetical protein
MKPTVFHSGFLGYKNSVTGRLTPINWDRLAKGLSTNKSMTTIVMAILPNFGKARKRWDSLTIDERFDFCFMAGFAFGRVWCSKKYYSLPIPLQFIIHEEICD